METIAIGCIVRNRPKLFAVAFKALSRITVPEDCRLVFVVLADEAEADVAETISRFQRKMKQAKFLYAECAGRSCRDPRACILEAALAEGCDRLAFVESHHIVDPDWLTRMVQAQRKMNVALVGGPQNPLWPLDKLGPRQKAVRAGISKGMRRANRASRKATQHWRKSKAPVPTNNWLFDLAFFRETPPDFPCDFGVANGSDSLFIRNFQNLDGLVAWEPNAVIRVVIPPEALTFRNQFDRGRTEAYLSHIHRARCEGRMTGQGTGLFIFLKVLGGSANLIRAVFDGGRSFGSALTCFGMVAGQIDGLRGSPFVPPALKDLD